MFARCNKMRLKSDAKENATGEQGFLHLDHPNTFFRESAAETHVLRSTVPITFEQIAFCAQTNALLLEKIRRAQPHSCFEFLFLQPLAKHIFKKTQLN